MTQQPIGLPSSEIREAMIEFLDGGISPTPDEFRSELVRRWQNFTSRMAIFSESEAA